jgi:tetratricopeptide (TPR) repeat protein
VSFDRAATLKNAEKLLRQGKLPDAIAEYVRVVREDPTDFTVANTLGDLYGRAGQPDKAVEQFVQIADGLQEQGGVAKAAAVYKKILKIKPDHDHTLWQLADILGGQGLYADARSHLHTLIELRRGRGDTRGTLQARVRLGSLDPNDLDSRRAAASARIEMGDVAGAMRDLKEISSALVEKGRHADAIEVLRQAATLNPKDHEVREGLMDVYFASGDFARAREFASSVDQYRLIAAALEGQGRTDEALDTLGEAVAADPGDTALAAEVAKAFVQKGDLSKAAKYLTVETAGDDPALLLSVADIHLRGKTFDEGMVIVRRLLDEDVSRREQIAQLGWSIAEAHPEPGFRVTELAADTAVAQSDWPGAAAVLQEFVTRVPNHIPALMRLVEICVDGGLEATMYSAQAQLADAYITAGSAEEARFIAEDLVAREPWEKSNIERFRRALVLLGEPDPEGLIASRLSGETPFTSTDPTLSSEFALDPAPEPAAEPPNVHELLEAAAAAEEGAARDSHLTRRSDDEPHFELSANAIDLQSILADHEAPLPPAAAGGPGETVEVDLSIVLDDIKPNAPAPEPPPVAQEAELPGKSREQGGKRTGLDDAEKEYKRALALRSAGDIDGCIKALETASRAPKLRFSCAWLIARLYRDRQMVGPTIEWLGRATQTPPPTRGDGHQVLYELAEALESIGENARALAICLELQAEAGDYRDVQERIDRLAKSPDSRVVS